MIRALGPGDLPALRPLRLRALLDHPEAFGTAHEEDRDGDLSRLIAAPPGLTLGAFEDGALVASAALLVSARVKQRHKGHIVGVYVAPEARNRGLGRALVDALVAHARGQGLRVVTLTVSAANPSARRLYEAAGFAAYGREPRALLVGGALLDEDLMAVLLD